MTIDEAQIKWREIHRACKTVMQQVEMTQSSEYQELVKILFPEVYHVIPSLCLERH